MESERLYFRMSETPGDGTRRRPGLLLALLLAVAACRASPAPAPYFFVDHLDEAELALEGIRSDTNERELWDVLTLGSDTRRALRAPFPSRLSFTLDVPDNAGLRFAIGASTLGRPNLLVPIEFSVSVDSDDREERVFEDGLRRSQPNRWFPRNVDLSRWAGRSIRLTFETGRLVQTRPRAEEHVLPLWGNPVLVDRTAKSAKPNLILISIDCLRADHLRAYGYERETGPQISAFAREAVVFETVVAASSYTLPTHAAMLTGLPPSLHRANVKRRISRSAPYVPEALSRDGYRVSGVVSAAFLSQTYGFERGFHTYRVTGGRASHVIDESLKILAEGEGQPQFFFLHLYDPHAPYKPPREFIERFGERRTNITELLERLERNAPPRSDIDIEQAIALYDAEIAYVDHELGRFFDELKARDLYDASLIVLTADHGEAFQEHGAWQHGGPVLHEKPGLYQEIVHVPLIIKWPGEKSGARVPAVVSQMDVAATLLEAAGMESSSPWAMGLRRHVDGGKETTSRPVLSEALTYDPEYGGGLSIALTDETLKYIAWFRAESVGGLYEVRPFREELYDLRNDPREVRNLMDDPGFNSGSLRAALQSYLKIARESGSADEEDIVLDEELLEELRSLGYLDP